MRVRSDLSVIVYAPDDVTLDTVIAALYEAGREFGADVHVTRDSREAQ